MAVSSDVVEPLQAGLLASRRSPTVPAVHPLALGSAASASRLSGSSAR